MAAKKNTQDKGMKDWTELVFILDRSGSMTGLESDTIGGFNSVLGKHREMEGTTKVTTILFDHEVITLHDHLDISEVKPMTERDYQTRGCTALLDAVGGAIEDAVRLQRCMPEEARAAKVIFVITTDGLENASTKYSAEKVRKLIEHETEKYGWEFIFMGANMDAVAEARNLGIAEDRAVTYMADSEGSAVMYEAVADFTCKARSLGKVRQGGGWKKRVEADVASRR